MTVSHCIQLLTFTLAGEVYATNVECAREVLEFAHVTPLPKAPTWMRGVLNLRGNVIPVLDMKQKLGMGPTEGTRDTCVLILEIDFEGEATLVGMLADSVREVIEVHPTELDPPPRFGSRVSTEYVKGVGRRHEQLYILLDIPKIFAEDDLELAQEAQTAGFDVAPDAVSPREVSLHDSAGEVPTDSTIGHEDAL